MPEKRKRKFYYSVTSVGGKCTNIRDFPGACLSEVIDKSTESFHRTWDKYPDYVEVKRKNTYKEEI